MGPGMRGIMRMLETNSRNHLFDDLQEIIVSPLPDLPGCQSSSGMRKKNGADALLQLRLPDHRLKPIGQIDDLFRGCCFDTEDFAHRKMVFMERNDILEQAGTPS